MTIITKYDCIKCRCVYLFLGNITVITKNNYPPKIFITTILYFSYILVILINYTYQYSIYNIMNIYDRVELFKNTNYNSYLHK